ncbi:MAG: hypothetical protein IIV94_09735, partial [Clostridiales bacterium]|nr:hypothetical protein [Clostridiales bacterium]
MSDERLNDDVLFDEDNDDELLDWDDEIEKESEYTILPAGTYDFEIVNFERSTYAGSDKLPACKMAIVTFKITDGDKSALIFERYYLCKKIAIDDGLLNIGFRVISFETV